MIKKLLNSGNKLTLNESEREYTLTNLWENHKVGNTVDEKGFKNAMSALVLALYNPQVEVKEYQDDVGEGPIFRGTKKVSFKLNGIRFKFETEQYYSLNDLEGECTQD